MKKIFIAIALLFSLTLTSANTAEVSVEAKITGLYVAYFNRAADQSGLEYWTNKADEVAQQGGDVSSVFKTISAGFATHPTFTSTYAHLENKEFVEAIYRNALGRDGDAEGIAYWTDLLNRGMIRSDMVATFVELSMVKDLTKENFPNLTDEELAAAQLRQDLITNKVTVALTFTHQLDTLSNVVDDQDPESDPAYLASIKIISEVTENATTVSSALGFLTEIKESDDPIKHINEIISLNTGGVAQLITHNGTDYGTVTSPHTGKVWLDRNLGAARVCETLDDTACYGDYYQWGRNFDGHEDSTSAVTTTMATDIDSAGADFIKDPKSSGDWLSTDATGSTRISNWSATDGSSVCPTGYRVPSIAELQAETTNVGVREKNTAFNSFLKLPSAGHRNPRGLIQSQSTNGAFWSISVAGTNQPYRLVLESLNGSTGSSANSEGYGHSVRCIKN